MSSILSLNLKGKMIGIKQIGKIAKKLGKVKMRYLGREIISITERQVRTEHSGPRRKFYVTAESY